MATKKVKISELPQLPETAGTEGVYAVGADTDNKTYRVPLERLDQTDAIKAITSAEGMSALINQLPTGTDWPKDDDYFISQYVGGGETNKGYHRRKFSALWGWINQKLDSLYIPKSKIGNAWGDIYENFKFPDHAKLIAAGYCSNDNMYDTIDYYKGLCKYLVSEHSTDNSPYKSFIGISHPNSLSNTMVTLYDRRGGGTNAEGLPQYCLGFYTTLEGAMRTFGTTEYRYYHYEANTSAMVTALADYAAVASMEGESVDLDTYKDAACAFVDKSARDKLAGVDRDRLLDALIDVSVGQPVALGLEEADASGVNRSHDYLTSYNEFRQRVETEAVRVKEMIAAGTTKREVDEAVDGSEISSLAIDAENDVKK